MDTAKDKEKQSEKQKYKEKKWLAAGLAVLMTGTVAAGAVATSGTGQPPALPAPTPTTEVAPEVEDADVLVKPQQPAQDAPLPEGATEIPMASAHFAMAEYACDCDGYCDGWPSPMDEALLERIEVLRESLGAPVIITSGVRCPRRNAEVGGIEYSRHLSGHAADLYCPSVSIETVAQIAGSLGLTVIPYYDQGFIHVEN